jgi:hypothetical protein
MAKLAAIISHRGSSEGVRPGCVDMGPSAILVDGSGSSVERPSSGAAAGDGKRHYISSVHAGGKKAAEFISLRELFHFE